MYICIRIHISQKEEGGVAPSPPSGWVGGLSRPRCECSDITASERDTGVTRCYETAPPPRTTIGP